MQGCTFGAEVRRWMLCAVLDTIPEAENASWVGVAEGHLSHQRAGCASSRPPPVVGGRTLLVSMVYPRAESSLKS